MKEEIDWLSFMQSLQSLAQTGIAYAKDEYDRERYQEILKLVSGQYAVVTGADTNTICATLFNEIGYATPKICVRGVICEEDKILLVKERAEALWSLPGGWAEVNLSPSQSLVKEVKEETGFNCNVARLLAFWDKQMHEHPPHWPHTYLAFYHCQLTGGELTVSHEISEVKFFSLDELPQLSLHRVTPKQIQDLYLMVKENLDPRFD